MIVIKVFDKDVINKISVSWKRIKINVESN